jgi:CRP/FNR family transcriptional regulator
MNIRPTIGNAQLRLVSLRQDCIDGETDDFCRFARLIELPAGKVASWEGGTDELVGVVVSGVLTIVGSDAGGRRQIVGVARAGQWFGTVYGTPSFSHEAAVRTRVRAMPRSAAERLFCNRPDLALQCLKRSHAEVEVARRWLALLARHRVVSRFAGLLLSLGWSASGGTSRPEPEIRLPIPRKDVASLIGTTTESLSRTISALSADGVLSPIARDRFRILDLGRLEQIAASDEATRASA